MVLKDLRRLLADTVTTIENNILGRKNAEYAAGKIDCLHNFKLSALQQECTPERALEGLLSKHLVSIHDMIRLKTTMPLTTWDEKIHDAIGYLVLLRALVHEESYNESCATGQ